jgi:hypothetical protein
MLQTRHTCLPQVADVVYNRLAPLNAEQKVGASLQGARVWCLRVTTPTGRDRSLAWMMEPAGRQCGRRHASMLINVAIYTHLHARAVQQHTLLITVIRIVQPCIAP